MNITTLIPAYKHKYCLELLISLRHQTIKPSKIIFSDDSPDQAFVDFLSTDLLKNATADLNIEVIPGPRAGAWSNFRHLIDYYLQQGDAKTEYFHILLDDDIIYPRFYERHLEAHRLAHLSCVISRRWTALESGQPIGDTLPVPQAVLDHPHNMLLLTPEILFQHTVGTSTNWLGEFSNVTFHSNLAREISNPSIAEFSYVGLEDLGSFLKASLYAPVGYVKDFLGAFRTSPHQHSANPMGRPLKCAFLAYIVLAIAARKIGQLSDIECTQAIFRASHFILNHYDTEDDMKVFCRILRDFLTSTPTAEANFLAEWKIFLAGA